MKTSRDELSGDNTVVDVGITKAWSLLSHSGASECYIGCSSDGLHEITLCDPGDRLLLAIGRGVTIEAAICAGVREIEQKREVSRCG